MSRLPTRIIFIVVITFVSSLILTGPVFAKNNNSLGVTGWRTQNNNSPALHVGPPPFSVHPIEGPEDVPSYLAAIRGYVQELREYIASLRAGI